MFVYTLGDVFAVVFLVTGVLVFWFAYGVHKMNKWWKETHK